MASNWRTVGNARQKKALLKTKAITKAIKKQKVRQGAAMRRTGTGDRTPTKGELKKTRNQLERPEPMYSDPEDPLSWEEKFGNFNLSRFDGEDQDQPPKHVRPVKRLTGDLKALIALTQSTEPPQCNVRPGRRANAIYGFGGASKDGLGASLEIEGKGVMWRSGAWNWSMREESSNYREFRNLVEMIESLVDKGTLRGHELFMFTDNSTAESAFFKGSSSSEKIFDLVLRLRKIEMKGQLFVHLIHVSGTSMIWSGVDGLSRGDRNAGIMTGASMLLFVPIAQSAIERSPKLASWITEWGTPARTPNKEVKVLSPTEWCDLHPSGKTYVWVPPPAAASYAIEWLGQSIHKRPDSVHIMVVPRLCNDILLAKATLKNSGPPLHYPSLLEHLASS
jgi:hypothetical protein